MLRTRYLLLRRDADAGEEPQALSGLPDPCANAQKSEGGSPGEQEPSLEMRVREASFRGAVPSPAGKRNRNFSHGGGNQRMGNLYTVREAGA